MNSLSRNLMRFSILACALVVTVAPIAAGAALSPPVLLGQLGGTYSALAANGDYLYAGQGAMLAAYRRDSETGCLVREGGVFLDETASRIVVRGHVAYVVTEEGFLWLIDISMPGSPSVLSSVSVGGPACDIALGAAVAYVSWANIMTNPDTGGVTVVDISAPSLPSVTGAYSVGGAGGALFLDGNTLYVAWSKTYSSSGCDIVDVADPSSPVLSATLGDTVQISSIYVTDAAGFFLASDGTLKSLDMAAPDFSTPLGTLFCPSATAMVVSGDFAYATGYYGLVVVDLSDPANMTTVFASRQIYGYSPSALGDGLLYTRDSEGGLVVIDITDPAAPSVGCTVESLGTIYGLRVAENRVYLVQNDSRVSKDGAKASDSTPPKITIVDTSDPTNPAVVGSYTSLLNDHAFGYGIDASGDLVCVAWHSSTTPSSGRLDVFDVSDASSPRWVAAWSRSGYGPFHVTLEGTMAYVVADSPDNATTLFVFDLSIPSSPVVTGACGLRSSDDYIHRSFLVDDGMFYAAREDLSLGGSHLEVIDVHDPATPYLVDDYDFVSSYLWPYDLAVASETLYLTLWDSSVAMFDVSVPVVLEEPVLFPIYDSDAMLVRAVTEYERLYVMSGDGFGRVDITEPLNPVVLDTSPCLGFSKYMEVRDCLIYTASTENGLQILDDGRRPLTIAVEGHGTTDPAPGAGAYDTGTAVTITAQPEPGYMLHYWVGDVEPGTTANPLVVTADGKKSVTAVFARATYTLTTSKQGSGYTDPAPGSHVYGRDAQVTVAATPEENWVFDHWEGDYGDDATANPIVLTMLDDKAVTAVFTQIQRTLTLSVSGQGVTAPAAGAHAYPYGTAVSVTALAEAGWRFDHWEGDFGADATANPVTVMLDQDRSLAAVFVEITHTLSLRVEGQGTISPEAGQHTYAYGTQVMLTATPAEGWRFERWESTISKANTANPIVVTMAHDQTITAVFVEDTAGCSGGTSTKSDAAAVGFAALGLWLSSLFRGVRPATATKG